jgi:hypothetical protein
MKRMNDRLDVFVPFHASICNGEIVNAVYTLCGFSSTSKLTKVEFFRRLKANFPMVYRAFRERHPSLDEDTFRQMLDILEPCRENPWLSRRNDAAHRVSIGHARTSASEDDSHRAVLHGWIDLIAGGMEDTKQTLVDAAFKNKLAMDLQSPDKPVVDFPSFMDMLRTGTEQQVHDFVRYLRAIGIKGKGRGEGGSSTIEPVVPGFEE